MMDDYDIRRFQIEDFESVASLMFDCFGMDVDTSYLKWKYLDNPSGRAIGFIAIHINTNQPSSFFCVIPETYIVNGEKMIIYQSCDSMTHSKHRRKGLYKAVKSSCIQLLKEKDALFVFGFSGNINSKDHLKSGWKQLFKMRYYFTFNYPRGFKTINGLSNESVHLIRDYNLIEHLTLQSNDAKIHSLKSSLIYKWRLSNPRKKYVTLAILDKKRYVSYLTYNIEDRKLYLLDFIFPTKEHGKILLGELKQKVQRLDLRGIVSYVQENSNLSNQLKQLGFINNPFKIGPLSRRGPFFFYSSHENMEKLGVSDYWLISSFDHDAM